VGVLARDKKSLTSLPRKGRLLSQIPHLSSLTVSLPLCGIAGEDAHVPGFGTNSMRKSECIILNTLFRKQGRVIPLGYVGKTGWLTVTRVITIVW